MYNRVNKNLVSSYNFFVNIFIKLLSSNQIFSIYRLRYLSTYVCIYMHICVHFYVCMKQSNCASKINLENLFDLQ